MHLKTSRFGIESYLSNENGLVAVTGPHGLRRRQIGECCAVGPPELGSRAWSCGLSDGLQWCDACGWHRAGMPWVKLSAGDVDMVPSNHWPEPLVAEPVHGDCGPVPILIEYRVEKHHRASFLDAIVEMSQERRRDGACGWGVTEDTADPQKIVEWFMVESWAEHLRQHKRVSNADADLQGKVLGWHIGPQKPVIRHFTLTITANLGRKLSKDSTPS